LRGLLFLTLIAALCGGLAVPLLAPVRAAPQMQAATDIVISEFRVRGPTGGTDEFVELYNPTSNPVDIGGWTISGSNNAGTTSARATIPAGTILQSGQHYLVAKSGGYSGSVAVDLLYTATGIADDGGIGLLRADSSIADQVGMSAGSAYLEGTTLTPLSGNLDQSYERIYDPSFNCIDSTNNATDFFIRNPSDPQNSSSPITTCGDPNPLLTATAASNLTGTAALNLTGTAASNLTGTAASNFTGTAASNLTGTAASNLTGTAVANFTRTPTSTPVGFMSVIINEVAWAGTAAALTSDEWIELYNPGSIPIDLTLWTLKSPDNTPTINLTGVIPAGGYFLLERTDDTTVSDIGFDQIYSGDLGNTNEILNLLDPSNRLIDTANSNGGAWPAGSSVTFGSMERRTGMVDSDIAWITNTGVVRNGLDALGNPIKGTPKNLNWATTVIPTPSSTPTRTRTPLPPPTLTRTPTLAPVPRVAINEFVPRPGHDWNNDGTVNVEDEYIEIINHGTIDVNLNGYSLDDEVNIGSNPYRLPGITIKPGERIVFYGSETGLLLSDGGDGVRLLRPNGQLADAYNYTVVRFPDQSYCRLPDDGGADDWNTNCYPTPGLRNALGASVVNPPDNVNAEMLCPIADTLPIDFILAECPPFGNNIWRPAYWDNPGWYGENYLPESPGKWPVFVD